MCILALMKQMINRKDLAECEVFCCFGNFFKKPLKYVVSFVVSKNIKIFEKIFQKTIDTFEIYDII